MKNHLIICSLVVINSIVSLVYAFPLAHYSHQQQRKHSYGQQQVTSCLGVTQKSDDLKDTIDTENNDDDDKAVETTDNKAMAFLRKIGKVGGASTQDFVNSMGVDEGPVGRSRGGGGMKNIRKAKSAYQSCVNSGVIDDMSEPFPMSTCGTQWSGFTDRVMGGVSFGSLTREEFDGKTANVLRGHVSLANDGGFIQMATDLALDPTVCNTVDASKYNGIELDVQCQGKNGRDNEENEGNEEGTESFNVHLKNKDCLRKFSSYRATFNIPIGQWKTIRLPWSEFVGKGPGTENCPLDVSTLRRLGIVAIGKEMSVILAASGLRFY